MLKLKEQDYEFVAYTQLSSTVLAVIVLRRVNSWCVYVGDVQGIHHEEEWEAVRDYGTKLKEPVAKAIAENYFFPGIDTEGLSYAH